MKIIEALKKIKDLRRKADDLQAKIARYCADLDCETPTYPDQRGTVRGWIQSHTDILKEIMLLKYRLQKTNVLTNVTIELGGSFVSKPITQWIERRKTLCALEKQAWSALTDRNLKEGGTYQLTPQAPVVHVKRRLYFDPVERDTKIALLSEEPSLIDSALEIVNATTDLVE